jgi:hypothetical protein
MTFKNYKEGDTITEKEYIDINNAVSAKWNDKCKTLELNKTVYFDKNVQTSRTEFKKQFPTNKIVHSLKDAHYYITNNKPNIWISFYQKKSRILNVSEFNKYYFNKTITGLNECVDFINSENIIINAAHIKFKSEESELPQEMKEKLTSMLGSDDKETFDLGWNILFQYDHIKSMDDFHLIISKASTRGFWKRKKSRVIEQKLKQIKANYPNSRY